MRKMILLFAFCIALKGNAQDYLITFTGTGAATTVSTVRVENLTKSTSLTLTGSDVLRLTGSTGINSIENNHSAELKIYPNPMSESSTLEIWAPAEGDAIISVLDMTGKPVAQFQSYLEKFRQGFRLSGFKNGFYLINVKGNNYQFSGKLLCNGKSNGTLRIEKLNTVVQIVDEKALKTDKKGTLATVDMAYSTGDRLKFTGTSGNYSTVKVDSPTSDKTVSFNFIPCTDGDNNNYSVVEIGTQVWMAENLKTTSFKDGTLIPYGGGSPVDLTTPGYTMSAYIDPILPGLSSPFYNIHAAATAKLCPTGWHLPTDEEWTILGRYLGGNALAGDKIKSTSFLGGTNESGFTALPDGYRRFDGSYSYLGINAIWWSATDSSSGFFTRDVNYNYSFLFRHFTNVRWCSVRCMKGELPEISTFGISNATPTTAICGGNITGEGSSPVTARGVCWSALSSPTISDPHTSEGSSQGNFNSTLTGLAPGTQYFVRAYASNSEGTQYGKLVIFNTKIADVDGNTYNTVTIGSQVWMAENLNTTKYSNGDLIGTTTPAGSDIRGQVSPKYQWAYSGNEILAATYGRLYTWFPINDSRNVCPTGWHVPSMVEWTTLTDYLGGLSMSGGKLKESGLIHWQNPNTGATNEMGFTALPGGYRFSSGGFGGLGTHGLWWSLTEVNTTDAWTLGMGNTYTEAYGADNAKNSGYSIRCLK